ncbi:hypothetical protein ACWD4P_30770 [Kitasatospora sp. NPDC002543]
MVAPPPATRARAPARGAAPAADGVPADSCAVDAVDAVRGGCGRLRAPGVCFTRGALALGPVATAVPDGARGGLVRIARYH